MCIPTFEEFLLENPTYQKFEHSTNARNIYDYLSLPETIEKLIAANEHGKPALYGAQFYIESNFAGYADFDLEDNFVRQCVGNMVRTILKPFGYRSSLQRDLPKSESKYFKSATYYSLDKSAIECLLIKKVAIEKYAPEITEQNSDN